MEQSPKKVSFSADSESYYNNKSSKRLSNFSVKSLYAYDPIKENYYPLPDEYNCTETDSINSTSSNCKSGKCLVDIKKLHSISNKMDQYRIQQKKLVTAMNHIVNEYNTLNKNFKKIQKEFNNFLKNENDDFEFNERKLSIVDSPVNNDFKSYKAITPVMKELNKSLFTNQFSEQTLSLLGEKVEKVIIKEGNEVVTENEKDNCIYYLISGEAYVYDFFENKIANIHPDNWFGLFALLGNNRTATIKTTLDSKFYKLSIDDILAIFDNDETAKNNFESIKNEISEIYNRFMNSQKKDSICRFKNEFLIELAMHILMKIPIFEHLEMKFLFDLVENMIPEVVPKGKIIISRDDEPDCLYCVLNGMVEVFSYPEDDKKIKDHESNEVLVHAELSSDSFFGEIGLLLGIRRTSSIRIKKKSFLIKLTKEILESISNNYPNAKIGIDKRASGCIQKLQDNNVNSDSLEQFDFEVNVQNLRKIKLFNNFDNCTLEELAMGMTRQSYQPNEFIIKCDEKAEW